MAGCRKRSLDGTSRVQKVAAVEKCFRGCLWWFGDIWEYIDEKIRSGGSGGAQGWERAFHPCGRLVAPPSSSPSPLVVFWSKKNNHEGFIPFGLRLVFLFFETLKQGKKQKLALGSRLMGWFQK